ncbi:hypothetical protein JCM1841_005797 [Sporobolomyces salmonicolor]
MTSPLLSTGPAVVAPLTYFKGTTDGQKPYQLMYESTKIPDNNVEREHPQLPIHDLRPLLSNPDAMRQISVDTTGFAIPPKEISRTKMQYSDWDNEETIKSVYYPELETMLKEVTGASKVIFFDHTIRKGERKGEETPDTPTSRKPVSFVHVDQTPESGRRRVLRHGGEDGERLLRGRAQIINVWRPLRGPVLDTPLAVADARTLVPDEDLVPSRLVYPTEGPDAQPEGETFQIKRSERHKWFYLSEMQPDELLLLKCWENRPDGGVRTPHTAFIDPRYIGRDDIPLRQSIEVRALVFHEPEE